MATQLGAKLNIDNNLQVYLLLPVSKMKIFVVFNPCHVKIDSQHSFGKLPVIVDGNDNTIK